MMIGVLALMAFVKLACYIPANKAARGDPNVARGSPQRYLTAEGAGMVAGSQCSTALPSRIRHMSNQAVV